MRAVVPRCERACDVGEHPVQLTVPDPDGAIVLGVLVVVAVVGRAWSPVEELGEEAVEVGVATGEGGRILDLELLQVGAEPLDERNDLLPIETCSRLHAS